MDSSAVRRLIEGAIFSSPGPLSAAKLVTLAAGFSAEGVRQAIDELNALYRNNGHAFLIEEIAGGYRLLTLRELGEPLAAFFAKRAKEKLSRASLETLAIVAYKQPVTRAALESIRGVASDYILASLTDLGLIRIVGTAEAPGRPMLYGTTRKFLDHFGLKSLKDLPREKDFDSMEQA